MGSSKAAMEEDGAVLEWALYDSNSKTAFQKLYNDTDFSDVTLACEDNGRIEAHRAVLGVSSDFFLDILKETSTGHCLIYLEGVTLEDLQLVKSFVYLGKATVRFAQYESFASVAKRMLGSKDGDKDGGKDGGKDGDKDGDKDGGKDGDKDGGKDGEKDGDKDGGNESGSKPAEDIKPKLVKEEPLEEAKDNKEKQGLNVSATNVKRKYRTSKQTSALERLISCKICTVTFPTKLRLRKHMNSVHSNIQLNEPCPYQGCNATLKNKNTLNGHIKMLHTGQTQRFTCDQCDYSTKHRGELMRHNRRHTGDLIQCELCSYSCTRMSLLSEHNESCHLNATYTCEQCGTEKKTKKMLKRHIKIVHEGICFYCELCNYKSTSGYNLRVHKETVHDKLSIKCKFCSFKDAQKSRVNLHEKREHHNQSV